MTVLIGSDARKTKMVMIKKVLLWGLLFSLVFLPTSCYRVSKDIEPQINYTVQDRYLKQLPSPFSPLTASEKAQDWGKEYLIGIQFARSLDLYRAITSFRRAEILSPEENTKRKLEMQYTILLCYYLGRKYEEVANAFTNSALCNVDQNFPAYRDLLVILYDTYQQLNEYDRAQYILELIRTNDPKTYETLLISSALIKANFQELRALSICPQELPYIKDFLLSYDCQKKSIRAASFLNAILPGAGYFYVGQRQTGMTAMLVNGLFIATTVYFFQHGPIAAGIIFASFEAGWYFGGIYGAAQQTKYYNERLYEKMATPMMNQNRLFPIFQLNYAF